MKTLADFVRTKSPMQSGRILKILNKERRIEGTPSQSYRHIEFLVNAGWVVNEARNILGERRENGLVVGITINKTECNYAEFLIQSLVWDSIVN